MSEIYYLDIEFPKVDFDSYYIKGNTEINQIHHAHLDIKENEIELRIFYEDSSN